MDPWKLTIVATALSPAVAAAEDFVATYSNRQAPVGQTTIPVEVGDVVEIKVSGDKRTVGRAREFTVTSYYEEVKKRGCKKHRKESITSAVAPLPPPLICSSIIFPSCRCRAAHRNR